MQAKLSKEVIYMIIAVAISIVFIIILAMSQGSPQTNDSTNLQTVSVSQFSKELADETDEVLLDLRTPDEFNSGRIESAINIDYYATDFRQQLEELDKSKSYKIYCNSGNRSGVSLGIMKDMGFENVSDLQGGIQAWMRSGNKTCTDC